MVVIDRYTDQDFFDLLEDLVSRTNRVLTDLVVSLRDTYIFECNDTEIFKRIEARYKRLYNWSFKNQFNYLHHVNEILHKRTSNITNSSIPFNNWVHNVEIQLTQDKIYHLQQWVDALEDGEDFIKKMNRGLDLVIENGK